MKRIALWSAAVFALVALLLLVAAPRDSAALTVERDVVYGTAQGTPLLLDLAMPKTGNGPFPVVVFLHGGGWSEGNRQEMNHFIEGVAGLGYVGVTVAYRLVPAARFPAQLEDCRPRYAGCGPMPRNTGLTQSVLVWLVSPPVDTSLRC